MSFKILVRTALLLALLSVSAFAQQHENDKGEQDSMYMVVHPLEEGGNDSTFIAELFVFIDSQTVGSASAGFHWDNPRVQMDSAKFSPEALDAFDFVKFVYRNNILDSTNFYQLFQFAGSRIFGTGLTPSQETRLVATYWFHITDWDPNEDVCIDTMKFSTGTSYTFVDAVGNVPFIPYWTGRQCASGGVELGTLVVSPDTLRFSAEEGAIGVPTQDFSVSEAEAGAIDYSSATDASWITILNGTGTTPGTVTVRPSVTGLAVGTYTDSVTVSSAEAGNAPVVIVELEIVAPARLQVIHNAADPAAELVDIYVNDDLLLDDFAFREATPFIDVPAEVTLNLGVAPSTSTSSADAIAVIPVEFVGGETYVAVANGVLDPGSFAANPDGRSIGFELFTKAGARESGQNGLDQVDFFALHGATDAPTVDVIARDVATLVDNAAYGDMTGYINVPAAPYILDVTPGADNNTIVASFEADLSGLGGGAAVVFASGFLDPPTNQSGPAFGLFAALPNGTVVEFPVYTAIRLAVSPDTLYLTQSEGNLTPTSGQVQISELGGTAIDFTLSTASIWLDLPVAEGTTPQEVYLAVNSVEIDPGMYLDSVMVTAEDADNSPVWVYVTLEVTPCPVLEPNYLEYSTEVFAGDEATIDRTVTILSTGPEELDWEVSQVADYFTFTPAMGNTAVDSIVDISYARVFETAGEYSDTAYIMTMEGLENFYCPAEVMVVVNVTVNREPSADTVIVVNTPAVAGMRVAVPVIFSNSCPLSELGLNLTWPGTDIFLDSVSFVGSAVEYVANKFATIDNDAWTVQIGAMVDAQPMIPIGSQELLATLHFSLNCEILNDSYPITLAGLGGDPVYFIRDCGQGLETSIPEIPPGTGNLIVGEASNFVCGYVVDPEGNEIEGATVELWGDFPFDTPEMMTTTSYWGSFGFEGIMSIPFDLFAYADGYYPNTALDLNFGDKGVVIVLEPLQELITTSQNVEYYCPDNSNLYLGAPVPVGSVVEAFTPAGLLVGRVLVSAPGEMYGLFVYRSSVINPEDPDDGAEEGETISFKINGMPAIATGNTEYPASYQLIELCLEVRGSVEKTCDLFPGWNLISWNVNTDTDDIQTLLHPIMDRVEVVLGFEQGAMAFHPDLLQFSTLWYMDHTSGYWIKITDGDPVPFTVTGLPVPEDLPIPMNIGWNLLSYLPEMDMAPVDALASIEENLSVVYGFNLSLGIEAYRPNGGDFNKLANMSSCNGYWYKLFAADVLVYGAEPLPVLTVPAPARRPAPVASLGTASQAVTSPNWVNLYSKSLTLDGRTVEAGATIEAYSVEGDRQVGGYVTNSDGLFGFMPVYIDAPGEDVIGMKAGDQFYLTVNGVKTEEVFDWTSNGAAVQVAALTARGSNDNLPFEYSLDQNYPNPFNPTTTIMFTMPGNGHARIEVFNILGRLIATPFDGQASAGANQVVWDGRTSDGDTAASGVYFYRLTADNFSETRKMMLLK